MFDQSSVTESAVEMVLLPESDDSLAARAAIDEAAFVELYRRYVDQIFGFCLLRLSNRALAEDCTSQVFTKVIESLPRFRPEHFRSWIFTIARRVVIDQQRRRPTVSLDAEEVVSPSIPGPEESTELELASREMRLCLSKLTPDQRSVIELRLSGLTGPEIGKALARSDAWVRTTQYRAIRELRRLMQVAEPGEEHR